MIPCDGASRGRDEALLRAQHGEKTNDERRTMNGEPRSFILTSPFSVLRSSFSVHHLFSSAANEECNHVGFLLPDSARGVRPVVVGPGRALRPVDGRRTMTGTELIALLVAAALLVYLVFALLKPEWFA
jgi:K+-transporting ATPase KdpF subunit